MQKETCKDSSDHQFSLIYKFYSPVTRYKYVLRAEYHRTDTFAIMFYAKKDRRSDFKYNKILNRGDLGNLLVTCAKAVPLLLQQFPTDSFGFLGSRTIETKYDKAEPYSNNQRFRVYEYFVAKKFGQETFAHYEYRQISGYLLVNRNCKNIAKREREIISMFTNTYHYLPDISL